MKLFLKTADSLCEVWVDDNHYEWDAGRGLAKGLLKYIHECLAENGGDWGDITGIGFFEGPGSFTRLRIGAAVVNTLADSENIPIVGAQGDDWIEQAKAKLDAGEDAKIVLPFYGAEANITTPKK